MKPLSTPDSHHLLAAQGWLELGNTTEADKALDEITPQLRNHPDVLEVRWRIYARKKKWDACVDIATAITKSAPKRACGWLHRSYALHEMRRTQEARDLLLPVVDRFPDEPLMRYNLACYECQLGRLEQAKQWLSRAFAIGDAPKLKLMALDDADLQPLWRNIGTL